MYQYTTNNPNSICARHKGQKQTLENVNAIIRDNLTLNLICDEFNLVMKTMDDASIPFNRLNEVVPDIKRIQSLTNILYH